MFFAQISGEVMMFVHIDTKTGDDCVSIAVTPKMTARELQRRALKKARAANYTGDASRFVLHEASSIQRTPVTVTLFLVTKGPFPKKNHQVL